MPYRENAVPPEVKREREYARHAKEMEARWDTDDGTWGEGIPNWAKNRFLDEKKAALEAMKAESARALDELDREHKEATERLRRKRASMEALDRLDENADAREEADDALDLALRAAEEGAEKQRRVAEEDAAIDRLRVDIGEIEPEEEQEKPRKRGL